MLESQVLPGYRVSLLSGESLNDLKITHANLFGLDAMARAAG